ncbi:GNAT family N-acetyltransferase [Leucobacter sp. M11]|uniref:GNAT family N-acetyltransferase n=1 Tax=Leucobacter sp. M11 TaxID=2993565 RepID=UPI002D7FB9DC|nr:GNAT family N-acetyltransferase [Leucobacter sp. M11]MEB4614788.1 GNAT family N-acetyltransferase [Leucobacter sp. M11]
MIAPSPAPRIRAATLDDLDARTWHGIAKLRQDVFVVEQDCPYPDLDERDGEPGSLHLWLPGPAAGEGGPGPVLATLRLLSERDGSGAETRRIGRVATAVEHRGQGLMAALLSDALDRCAGLPVVIEAQSYLRAWYEGFGFAVTGPEFLEDGIPHLPMLRAAAPTP